MIKITGKNSESVLKILENVYIRVYRVRGDSGYSGLCGHSASEKTQSRAEYLRLRKRTRL